MTTPEQPLPSLAALWEAVDTLESTAISYISGTGGGYGRRGKADRDAVSLLRAWLAAMEHGVRVYAFDDEVAAEANYEGSESFRTFRSSGAYAYGPLPCSRLAPYILIPMPKEAADDDA